MIKSNMFIMKNNCNSEFLVACYATLQPALSVQWSVRQSIGMMVGLLVCSSIGMSITLYFFFCSFWCHCSCPNDLVTSITAPTHLHATGVAVYLALFSTNRPKKVKDELKICFIMNWLAEMQILAIIAHLWPVFGLL